MSDSAAFHRRIIGHLGRGHAEEAGVASKVYADYLHENGKPAAAEFIRTAVDAPEPLEPGGPHPGMHGLTLRDHGHLIGARQHPDDPNLYAVHLHIPTAEAAPLGRGHELRFWLRHMDEPTAKRWFHALLDEGGNPGFGDGRVMHRWMAERRQRPEDNPQEPHRMSRNKPAAKPKPKNRGKRALFTTWLNFYLSKGDSRGEAVRKAAAKCKGSGCDVVRRARGGKPVRYARTIQEVAGHPDYAALIRGAHDRASPREMGGHVPPSSMAAIADWLREHELHAHADLLGENLKQSDYVSMTTTGWDHILPHGKTVYRVSSGIHPEDPWNVMLYFQHPDDRDNARIAAHTRMSVERATDISRRLRMEGALPHERTALAFRHDDAAPDAPPPPADGPAPDRKSRRGTPARYAATEAPLNHAEFHARAFEGPDPEVARMVYADKVQEDVGEAHARVVREHAGDGRGDVARFAWRLDPQAAELMLASEPGARSFRLHPGTDGTTHQLHLFMADDARPGHALGWNVRLPTAQAVRLARALAGEGATPHPNTAATLAEQGGREAPARMRRRGEVSRYAKFADIDHADWHREIAHSAEPHVARKVYADWVQEQGGGEADAHAFVIRHHETAPGGEPLSPQEMWASGMHGAGESGFWVLPATKGRLTVSLNAARHDSQPSPTTEPPSRPGVEFRVTLPREHALRLARDLHAEGARPLDAQSAGHAGVEYRRPQRYARPGKPVRYESPDPASDPGDDWATATASGPKPHLGRAARARATLEHYGDKVDHYLDPRTIAAGARDLAARASAPVRRSVGNLYESIAAGARDVFGSPPRPALTPPSLPGDATPGDAGVGDKPASAVEVSPALARHLHDFKDGKLAAAHVNARDIRGDAKGDTHAALLDWAKRRGHEVVESGGGHWIVHKDHADSNAARDLPFFHQAFLSATTPQERKAALGKIRSLMSPGAAGPVSGVGLAGTENRVHKTGEAPRKGRAARLARRGRPVRYAASGGGEVLPAAYHIITRGPSGRTRTVSRHPDIHSAFRALHEMHGPTDEPGESRGHILAVYPDRTSKLVEAGGESGGYWGPRRDIREHHTSRGHRSDSPDHANQSFGSPHRRFDLTLAGAFQPLLGKYHPGGRALRDDPNVRDMFFQAAADRDVTPLLALADYIDENGKAPYASRQVRTLVDESGLDPRPEQPHRARRRGKPARYARVPFGSMSGWFMTSKHRSGMTQTGRLLQHVAGNAGGRFHPDASAMAESALKGNIDALGGLHDHFQEIDHPLARVNWRGVGEYIRDMEGMQALPQVARHDDVLRGRPDAPRESDHLAETWAKGEGKAGYSERTATARDTLQRKNEGVRRYAGRRPPQRGVTAGGGYFARAPRHDPTPPPPPPEEPPTGPGDDGGDDGSRPLSPRVREFLTREIKSALPPRGHESMRLFKQAMTGDLDSLVGLHDALHELADDPETATTAVKKLFATGGPRKGRPVHNLPALAEMLARNPDPTRDQIDRAVAEPHPPGSRVSLLGARVAPTLDSIGPKSHAYPPEQLPPKRVGGKPRFAARTPVHPLLQHSRLALLLRDIQAKSDPASDEHFLAGKALAGKGHRRGYEGDLGDTFRELGRHLKATGADHADAVNWGRVGDALAVQQRLADLLDRIKTKNGTGIDHEHATHEKLLTNEKFIRAAHAAVRGLKYGGIELDGTSQVKVKRGQELTVGGLTSRAIRHALERLADRATTRKIAEQGADYFRNAVLVDRHGNQLRNFTDDEAKAAMKAYRTRGAKADGFGVGYDTHLSTPPVGVPSVTKAVVDEAVTRILARHPDQAERVRKYPHLREVLADRIREKALEKQKATMQRRKKEGAWWQYRRREGGPVRYAEPPPHPGMVPHEAARRIAEAGGRLGERIAEWAEPSRPPVTPAMFSNVRRAEGGYDQSPPPPRPKAAGPGRVRRALGAALDWMGGDAGSVAGEPAPIDRVPPPRPRPGRMPLRLAPGEVPLPIVPTPHELALREQDVESRALDVLRRPDAPPRRPHLADRSLRHLADDPDALHEHLTGQLPEFGGAYDALSPEERAAEFGRRPVVLSHEGDTTEIPWHEVREDPIHELDMPEHFGRQVGVVHRNPGEIHKVAAERQGVMDALTEMSTREKEHNRPRQVGDVTPMLVNRRIEQLSKLVNHIRGRGHPLVRAYQQIARELGERADQLGGLDEAGRKFEKPSERAAYAEHVRTRFEQARDRHRRITGVLLRALTDADPQTAVGGNQTMEATRKGVAGDITKARDIDERMGREAESRAADERTYRPAGALDAPPTPAPEPAPGGEPARKPGTPARRALAAHAEHARSVAARGATHAEIYRSLMRRGDVTEKRADRVARVARRLWLSDKAADLMHTHGMPFEDAIDELGRLAPDQEDADVEGIVRDAFESGRRPASQRKPLPANPRTKQGQREMAEIGRQLQEEARALRAKGYTDKQIHQWLAFHPRVNIPKNKAAQIRRKFRLQRNRQNGDPHRPNRIMSAEQFRLSLY